MTENIAIHWFRQDLRLSDNPSLYKAARHGKVLPLFILDDVNAGEYTMGGASRWWLHHSLASLNNSLGGNLSDNLSLSYVRTDYKDATKKDTDSISLNYTWAFGQEKHVRPTLFTLSDKAYEFKKLGAERYDLVKRENQLVKKRSGTLTVTGI